MDGTEWSFDNLNSICWAIGSIAGCLPDVDEKHFLIHTIRTLLNLCEIKKGKENKAVVASNIMYVVGQYPKFLRANWNFLKTVIKKLFEFMKETFPGVMQMSCNTFLKIAQKCGKEFVVDQKTAENVTEHEPYIHVLIRAIPEDTSTLDDQNKLIFYEALGHIVKSETMYFIREQLVHALLKSLIDRFQELSLQAQQNPNILNEEDTKLWLIYFLKINERVAFSVGYAYITILQGLAPSLKQYYSFYSLSLTTIVSTQGKVVLNWHTVKKMRVVKKEILKLYQTYFQSMNLSEGSSAQVTQVVIQPLSDLLQDYKMSIPELREPELLLLFVKVFEKLNVDIHELVPSIISSVFESTIGMISQDFNSFPDHRQYFFEFIKASVTNQFSALFNMPSDQFKLMIDCIIWAFRHQLPTLQDLGLDVMLYLLKTIVNLTNQNNLEIVNQFFSIYYMRLLKDILEILTDSLHKSGFKLQAQILHILIQIAQSQLITLPFAPDQNKTNSQFVYQFLVLSLSNAFTNISVAQTEQYVLKMFNAANNFQQFKSELRDYLINLTQFSKDNEHLFQDTQDQDQVQAQLAQQAQQTQQ